MKVGRLWAYLVGGIGLSGAWCFNVAVLTLLLDLIGAGVVTLPADAS